MEDKPLLPRPVPQATSLVERGSRSQILLKERAPRFHSRLIKSGKKAREGRTVRKTMATNERHKRFGKRHKPFIKGKPRGFARNCIANEHHDKIDEVVVS